MLSKIKARSVVIRWQMIQMNARKSLQLAEGNISSFRIFKNLAKFTYISILFYSLHFIRLNTLYYIPIGQNFILTE